MLRQTIELRSISIMGRLKGAAPEDMQPRRCSRGDATEEVRQRRKEEQEEEGRARVNHQTTYGASGINAKAA